MSFAIAMMLLADLPVDEVDCLAPPPVPAVVVSAKEAPPPAAGDVVTTQTDTSPRTDDVAAAAKPPSPPGSSPVPPPAPSVAQEQDIVIVGRTAIAGDPLVGINAPSFAVSEAVDGAVVAPIAGVYNRTLPKPVRDGIGNFLRNLREPVVFINYLLQAKPGKAAETLGRFAINTTIGAAGLLDVAKRRPFRLPFRPNGFANTFGFYGIKPGPFLFLPIVGATTPRDFIGLVLDRLVLPLAVGAPFDRRAFTIPTGLLHTIGRRNEVDATLRRAGESPDPYVTRRDLYLRSRQIEIDRLHGRPDPIDVPPPGASR